MEGNKYWQSLEELHEEPAFEQNKRNEFPEELPLMDALQDKDGKNPTSRRDFLKYMGFSITAATLAASCEMPVRKAIPYVFAPEEVKPGSAVYYASTFADGSDYSSILVKTRDGRPIKIEGNDHSSVTKGGTTARVQGSVLDLYNTNRKRFPTFKEDPAGKGEQTTWRKVDTEIPGRLNIVVNEGREIALLTSTILSPSTKQLIEDFKAKYPTVNHITYDPVSYSGMLDANESSFGQRMIPEYRFDKADVIVSLGADFLGTWLAPGEFMPQYAANRKPDNGQMSRHIQLESTLSLTGSNADVRTAMKPSELKKALLVLYNEIARKAGRSTISRVGSVKAEDKVKKTANELWNARGKSLVVAGFNGKDEQVIVNAINDMLGNYGQTINTSVATNYKQGNDKAFTDLISRMKKGRVGALLVHNCNPLYDNGQSKQFAEAAKNVNLRISFANAFNETDAIATYSCPTHHYLESWMDAEPKAGHYSLGQPTMRNIFDTRQFEDTLLTWMQDQLDPEDYDEMGAAANEALPADSLANQAAGRKPKPYRSKFYPFLKNYWQSNIFPKQDKFTNFQSFWDKALHDGVFEAPGANDNAEASFNGNVTAAAGNVKSQIEGAGSFELMLYEKVGIGNGSYADNPWLQEMPDPITKTTWDNYVQMSVEDAREFGLSPNDSGKVFEIAANDHKVKLPVVVQPGQAKGTLAIAVGYGRKNCGKAGRNIGQDAYPFLAFDNGNFHNMLHSAAITKTATNYTLARTQMHHVINTEGNLKDRTVIYEGILPEKEKTTGYIKKKREEFQHLNEQTLYPGHEDAYSRGHHWEMSIDLNTCIGCGACTIACHAENNVPVVGKTEVSRAHEMHWLRIDRYYTGDDMENPDVVFQPMLCQHCDNAPCENVCPVSATNHSAEGLNQMAYNRCVGTRYCANNCPYKVRRFNWYDYLGADSFPMNDNSPMEEGIHGLESFDTSDELTNDLTRMVLNPDVTIRSRGVMEKCSFCVQRIQESKLTAKKEGRALKDGDVTTACMQACPTHAIRFGDGNDKDSEVHKDLNDNDRTYYVIEEVNTKPSVGYMAKIRNRSAEEEKERKLYYDHGDFEGGHQETEAHS